MSKPAETKQNKANKTKTNKNRLYSVKMKAGEEEIRKERVYLRSGSTKADP